jgi:hypothetical protein
VLSSKLQTFADAGHKRKGDIKNNRRNKDQKPFGNVIIEHFLKHNLE